MEIDSDLLIFCDLETPPLKLFLELFIEKKYTPRGAMSLAIDLNIDQSLLEFWTAVLTVCFFFFF